MTPEVTEQGFAPVLIGSQTINGGLLLVVMWLAEQWRGGALTRPVRATV